MIVDTDRLVDKATIAEMCEVGPSAVSNWLKRGVGFPPKLVTICHTDYWNQDDIWEWFVTRKLDADTARKKRISRLREQLERLESV